MSKGPVRPWYAVWMYSTVGLHLHSNYEMDRYHILPGPHTVLTITYSLHMVWSSYRDNGSLQSSN